MDFLNIYILSRNDLSIKHHAQCFNYEIRIDYLTNEKSRFSFPSGITADEDDFLVAKLSGSDFKIGTSDGFRPLYFGVIESIEGTQINTCDLYNLVNFDIVATKKTGNNFGGHLQNLLNFYLGRPDKLISNLYITVQSSAVQPFSYMPENPPISINFVEYLINGFKNIHVKWCVDRISY